MEPNISNSLNFMPHGHCFFWTPDILITHVASDAVIGLAYFSIPVALAVLVKRRTDLAFNWMFILFASFIFACGTTHFIDVWNIWNADYRFEGVVKAITGGVSIVTAILLWPLLPKALALPSPQQLKDANDALANEVEARKQAEKDLRSLNSQLEEKIEERTRALEVSNQELEQFAYIASHDMQQPLRTISNMSELLRLRAGAKLDQDESLYMKHVEDAAQRMSHLVKSLLEYSRVGRAPERSEVVDCNELLRLTLHHLDAQIKATKAKIDQSKLPSISCDGTRLIQVFQNLISNAIKYGRKGDVQIKIGAENKGNAWVFNVTDNGMGIAPEFHDKIFEMFRRLHADDQFEGTGMGLAICKRIVESWGGKIWLESSPGNGTCFYFSVPV